MKAVTRKRKKLNGIKERWVNKGLITSKEAKFWRKRALESYARSGVSDEVMRRKW